MTSNHRPRNSPTCFTGQLIKLLTNSISNQMIKFASTRLTIPQSSCCNIEPCGAPRGSTYPGTGSISGIYYGSDTVAPQCPFSGFGLPFLGIGINGFTDFLVVDNCHGLQAASACLLAREKIFGKQCQCVLSMPLATR